jgi:hypothetical protein
MTTDFLLQSALLVVSNTVTAIITHFSSRKKQSAEENELIAKSYTTLVKDLQMQIESMKKELVELRGEILGMRLREAEMSLKIRNLEHENKLLKKI